MTYLNNNDRIQAKANVGIWQRKAAPMSDSKMS